MGNTFPKLHQVIGIAYNNDPNATHGGTITSSDAYHKAKWFLHHMNGMVLFRRYTRSLDTLELNVLISFSFLITIGEVCMFKSKTIIARCEQCDKMKTSFSFRQLTLSQLHIQGMFYRWSCDLAGELPQTSRGNVHIMIMIKHFSKLVALPDKSSHSTSQAFLQ
jgi:hypothetical protein